MCSYYLLHFLKDELIALCALEPGRPQTIAFHLCPLSKRAEVISALAVLFIEQDLT